MTEERADEIARYVEDIIAVERDRVRKVTYGVDRTGRGREHITVYLNNQSRTERPACTLRGAVVFYTGIEHYAGDAAVLGHKWAVLYDADR